MPSINEEEDLEKLSPRCMIETSNKPQDLEDEKYFKCLICMKILSDPKECSTCRTAFCGDCIEGWKKQKMKKCPLQCANDTYVDMHRVLKDQLLKKRFRCPIEGCPPYKEQTTGLEGYTYTEALQHQKECLYRLRLCKHGCGQKVVGHDIAKHEETCIERLETCQKCGCPYKVNDTENKHDCIQAMKLQA